MPALEQNILKYRAIEMTLFLFYAEELRNLLIGTIRTTDSIRSSLLKTLTDRPSNKPKNALRRALERLVVDGVLDESEKNEIERLVNYRNHIAHRIYLLTADIGNNKSAMNYRTYRSYTDPIYDYRALIRLRYYRRVFLDRTHGRGYVMTLSPAPLLFRSAEVTFTKELKRLHRKIIGQISKRKRDIAKLQDELSLKEGDVVDALQPYHPANQYTSGNLTKRGVEVCYRLYDQGKSPLAVAHLMAISVSAAINRKKLWQTAGGIQRSKAELKNVGMPPRPTAADSSNSA
jgi:hypothetical protein